MSKTSQYNLLAGLCVLLAAALLVLDKPDAQAMAFLALGGTLTGRGKA
jgi:hypothetical protein